jgi:protein-S-isoprenylcysteine O-methyltransferase Ste14
LPFLLLNYVASLPFLIVPFGLYYRSKEEESILIKQFGKKYQKYQVTTPRMIPRLCPRKQK